MAHDMIPELFGWDLRNPMWVEKHYGIAHASAFVCVSEATRRDLLRFFPQLAPDKVHVTPLAAAPLFYPRAAAGIDFGRNAHGAEWPHFVTDQAPAGDED